MKKTWFGVLPLFFALFCLSGCGGGIRLVTITINVLDVQPISDSQAKVTLRYVNENVTSFAVSSSKHKLYLNGQYVAQVNSREPVGLLQLNQTSQTLTFQLEKPEVLRSAQGSTAAYRIDSELMVQVGEDLEKLKSSSSGQVDLSGSKAK